MALQASESVRNKAASYLVRGQLRILSVRGERVYAECQGSEATPYSVGITGEKAWCNCPARARCAHIEALELVVGSLGARLDVASLR